MQKRQRRRGQDAITKRTQADNTDTRALGYRSNTLIFLCFYSGLVYQHHGDVIAHRIDALALGAFKPALVRFKLQIRLAYGTDQNLQQFLGNGHGRVYFTSLSCAPGLASLLTGEHPAVCRIRRLSPELYNGISKYRISFPEGRSKIPSINNCIAGCGFVRK